MMLDKFNLYRYLYKSIVGRGGILAILGSEPVIGEKTTLADTTDPQFTQCGPREFGGGQSGAEKLDFFINHTCTC